MISATGTPVLTRVLASASAKMPHFELIRCSERPSYGIRASRSEEISSLRAALSLKVPRAQRDPRARPRAQPVGGDLELARRLLDKGARTAAARRLHIDLFRFRGSRRREENRLHILAADFRHKSDVGVQPIDRK